MEQFFQCPYCFETISMILDTSVEEQQSYIEDCEVCCQPIQITFDVDGESVIEFSAMAIQ